MVHEITLHKNWDMNGLASSSYMHTKLIGQACAALYLADTACKESQLHRMVHVHMERTNQVIRAWKLP